MEANKMGITKEELQKRPVLIELGLGTNKSTLQWLVQEEHEYAKLAGKTVKQVVEFMRNDLSVIYTENAKKLAYEMQRFIDQDGKGTYTIETETSDTLACAASYDGKRIFDDERNQPILNFLDPLETEDNQKIWYQNLTISLPTFLGYKE